MTGQGVLSVWILCITVHLAKGAQLSFNTSVSSVVPGLTSSLTLTCTFNVKDDSLGGRDVTHTTASDVTVDTNDTTQVTNHVTHSSHDVTPDINDVTTSFDDATPTILDDGAQTALLVTQPAPNFAFLTSLIVSKNNGTHVASILEHFPAKSLLGDHLQVSGHLSSATGGQLTMTWQVPSMDEAAVYTCEANGMTSQGHSAEVTSSLEVILKVPETEDLVDVLRDLRAEVRQLGQQNANQSGEIQELRERLQQQEARTQAAQDDLSRLGHLESGLLDCGDDDVWNSSVTLLHGRRLKYVVVEQRFRQKYPNPPLVTASLHSLGNTFSMDTFFYIDLINVTEVGFVLRCSTLADSPPRVYAMGVAWLSQPFNTTT